MWCSYLVDEVMPLTRNIIFMQNMLICIIYANEKNTTYLLLEMIVVNRVWFESWHDSEKNKP